MVNPAAGSSSSVKEIELILSSVDSILPSARIYAFGGLATATAMNVENENSDD